MEKVIEDNLTLPKADRDLEQLITRQSNLQSISCGTPLWGSYMLHVHDQAIKGLVEVDDDNNEIPAIDMYPKDEEIVDH